MIKRLSIFALCTALLSAVGCTNEMDTILERGEEVTVTFAVGAENGVATRAGVNETATSATSLTYALFDSDNNYIPYTKNTVTRFTSGDNVTLTLVKDNEYKVVFWAQNPTCEAYELSDDMVLNINYAKVKNKDLTLDAFYCSHPIKVTDKTDVVAVSLKRPFAQINIGTTTEDYEKAQELGSTFNQSEITITGAATKMQLVTGAVLPESIPEVTLSNNVTLDENLTVGNVAYKYLSMCYILTPDVSSEDGSKKALLDKVTAKFQSDDGKTVSVEVNNVPVQRNYRTNIYGALLTDGQSINVNIDPGFNNGANGNNNEGNIIYSTKATFKDDLAQISASDVTNATIVLGEDVEIETLGDNGNSYLLTRPGVDLTIDGNGHTITAIGKGIASVCASEGGSLTIKNATIADKSIAYTESNWEQCYLELGGELILEKCNIVNGIMFRGTSLLVDDCDFNSNEATRYALWINNGTAEVKNSYFTGPRGIKIHDQYKTDVTDVTIDQCTFKNLSEKPGVAIDEQIGGNMTVSIKNSTFENTQAGDQNNYIYETKKVEPTLENNRVISTIADGLVQNIKDGVYEISTADGLMNANEKLFATSGNSYRLMADIDMSGMDWTSKILDKSVIFTFDGNGKTISNWNTTERGLLVIKNNEAMTIKNLTLSKCSVNNTNATETDGAGLLIGFSEYHGNGKDIITIENVKVNNCSVSSTANWTGGIIGYNSSAKNLTLKDCIVTGLNISGNGSTGAVIGHDAAIVTNIENATVTGCTIKGTTSAKSGIVVGTVQKETTISGLIYSDNTVFDIENSNAVYGRIVGGVLFMNGTATVNNEYRNGALVTNYLEYAIQKGVYNINLTADTYTIPSSAKEKTLTFTGIGNNKATTIVECNSKAGNGNFYGSTITFENLTINSNGETYNGFTHVKEATYNNCIINDQYTLYVETGKCTFNGCEFNVTGNKYNIWTWGSSDVYFIDCNFNCEGKSILIYAAGASNDKYTFDGCTFNATKTVKGKTAIQMHTEIGQSGSVTIANTVAKGFDDSIHNGLWNEVNNDSESPYYGNETDFFDITVDGEKVH